MEKVLAERPVHLEKDTLALSDSLRLGAHSAVEAAAVEARRRVRLNEGR